MQYNRDMIVGNYHQQNEIVFNMHRHVYGPKEVTVNGVYKVDLWSSPGYATQPQVVILLIGFVEDQPHFSLFPFGGKLSIPLSRVQIQYTVRIPAPGGRASVTYKVPNSQSLKGVKFYVQALVEQPSQPCASFSNLFRDQVK